MTRKRVPLYDRLPEIYLIKDEKEVTPPYQLKNYISLVEDAYSEIHKNIEALNDDLFIESCADWVIPYIGDLLGTSHLYGDPWTLRADVADTIHLRRRKGTLLSIERLTHNLTKWGVHCVELMENLGWNHNLNHQRPDACGNPPYIQLDVNRHTPIRGGTLPVRDPALLSLLRTPFDPFAYTADLKPLSFGRIRYNLPNLAIFLWRLKDYRVQISKPQLVKKKKVGSVYLVGFNIHPMGEPVRLLNTYQYDPERTPPVLTEIDCTPNPIPTARLNEISASGAGNPESYISVGLYNAQVTDMVTEINKIKISDVGLQLQLPKHKFAGEIWPLNNGSTWEIRGENLCAWWEGVLPVVKNREIVIDPVIGRILFGVSTLSEANALANDLLITYTYGAVGPVGAHPDTRHAPPEKIQGEAATLRKVNFHQDKQGLEKSLADLNLETNPVVIEIEDSMLHELDLASASVSGTITEDGGENLALNKTLVIRSATGERPVIQLKAPLRFRAKDAGKAEIVDVRLEGLYITRHPDFLTNHAAEPLISRAAVNRLEVINCTLDPGGDIKHDGTRADIHTSMGLKEPYGFAVAQEEIDFDQTPGIVVKQSICGPLLIDEGYSLSLKHSILDAGIGVGDEPANKFALASATDPADQWGPPTKVYGVTVFGRMRVADICGRGGIWVHSLEVQNNQKGCIRYSYFSGVGDRLPQNLGCVFGAGVDDPASLRFTYEAFGAPGYGQLIHSIDTRILEQGPENDQMGAYGFLFETHSWKNLKIRFREFVPVGITPLLIPVT